MEARSRIIRFPREALLVLAVSILVLAAIAGGYVLRLTTAPAPSTATRVVTISGSSAPGQADAPCVWTGSGKGC